MFSEQLKMLRKEKGLSQQELADMLCVVRQTVSKWEKGLSLPDADMLIKLANALGISVNELLGIQMENSGAQQEIIEQLMKINEQLIIKNRRSRKIWKIAAIIFGVFVLVNVVAPLLFAVLFMTNSWSGRGGAEVVSEGVPIAASEAVMISEPMLYLKDAISDESATTELTTKGHDWHYKDSMSSTGYFGETNHPLLYEKDTLDCVEISGELAQREFQISFPNFEDADELFIYGWDISELGNKYAGAQVSQQPDAGETILLKRNMVYEITAVWDENAGRNYHGSIQCIFYTK